MIFMKKLHAFDQKLNFQWKFKFRKFQSSIVSEQVLTWNICIVLAICWKLDISKI